MTLQDLYKAVSQLGFEDSLGDDSTDRFLYAANRALIEINSLRPIRKRFDINHRVPENLLFSEPTQVEKTETLSFTARNAKSFYFEVSGEGSFEIRLKKTDESAVTNSSLKGTFNSKTFQSRKGFIKYDEAFLDKLIENGEDYTGEVEIVFEGDYAYTIRNLALYDRVYSSSVADIPPYGEKLGYDVSTMVDDFEKFDSPPIDFLGNRLYRDYQIENNILYLPIEKQGTYTINYLHKVKQIPLDTSVTNTDEAKATIIDLDEDLAALMPNLIAAYVWLDDEPEKSQYYYNLYLQRAEQIKMETKDHNPVEFVSVYGW